MLRHRPSHSLRALFLPLFPPSSSSSSSSACGARQAGEGSGSMVFCLHLFAPPHTPVSCATMCERGLGSRVSGLGLGDYRLERNEVLEEPP
eukprot:1762312-Rhodomonas_salina.1